jgi:hypothetical protein
VPTAIAARDFRAFKLDVIIFVIPVVVSFYIFIVLFFIPLADYFLVLLLVSSRCLLSEQHESTITLIYVILYIIYKYMIAKYDPSIKTKENNYLLLAEMQQ